MPTIAEVKAAAESILSPRCTSDSHGCPDAELLARFVLAVLSAPGMTDVSLIRSVTVHLKRDMKGNEGMIAYFGWIDEALAEILRLRAGYFAANVMDELEARR